MNCILTIKNKGSMTAAFFFCIYTNVMLYSCLIKFVICLSLICAWNFVQFLLIIMWLIQPPFPNAHTHTKASKCPPQVWDLVLIYGLEVKILLYLLEAAHIFSRRKKSLNSTLITIICGQFYATAIKLL